MNVHDLVAGHVAAALGSLAAEGVLPAGLDLSRVAVETPRDPSHGDFSTNAAMVLSKEAGLKPRDLAVKLVAALAALPDIAKVDVAGPGFINLTLAPTVFHTALRAALADGRGYGRGAPASLAAVNVEYVSANPTGPMHVGHCRGAVFGDALANLLEAAGHAVTREYYINDAGAQVDVLGRSAYQRYREALGLDFAIGEGLYPGAYLQPVGTALAKAHGRTLLDAPETTWLPVCRDTAIDMMMTVIREDLAALNVRQSVFFSERSLQRPVDLVAEAIGDLRAAGQIYEGTLEKPKGEADDWEPREQTLFRATGFGDDVDRPLMKSDGSYTYFASDIAYHRDKYLRGFAHMIDVWGADHGGYVKRMQAATRAVTGGQGTLDVELVQLVKLMRGGEPVKMSKRSGEFITLRDVVDEVGRDAVRFMMLYRKNDATLEFDLAKVIEQSKENPVFYVQYGHARGSSVLRNAEAAMGAAALAPEALAAADLAALEDEGEIAILKAIADFPRLIRQAAREREPHRIAFYLYDLAGRFHIQWNRGKDLPHLRFLMDSDVRSTLARTALVTGVVHVLAAGLDILGVEAPQEMR